MEGMGWSSVNCLTRAGVDRIFSFNRQQLVVRLTDALIILYPVLGRHRPDLHLVCGGGWVSPLVDRLEGMKYLLRLREMAC